MLINIGRISRITHEWRAPEIRDEISPGNLSFKVRRLNDIWVYRKLLSEIVSHGGSSPFSETLNQVVACLTREDTEDVRVGEDCRIAVEKIHDRAPRGLKLSFPNFHNQNNTRFGVLTPGGMI